MALNKIRSAVVFFLFTAFVAAATAQVIDRIPGVPGKRRTHRLPADKSEISRYPRGEEGFPLNVNPEHVSAKDAPLGDNELVMGVVIQGEARAYPVNYMMGALNEVVNDTLGGQPIASTW